MTDVTFFPFAEDECLEVSVKTNYEEQPRGSSAVAMTSFEKLVHTALGLEKDPMNEHSYAFHKGVSARDGMDKDHSYFSQRSKTETSPEKKGATNLLPDHGYFSKLFPRAGSLKDKKKKSLRFSSQEDVMSDNSFGDTSRECGNNLVVVSQHYRSNDSALDMTSSDSVSDQYLSNENINLQTVDVHTEPRVNLCVSDPDISKMTIESSVSLPNSPNVKMNILDHCYSHESIKIQTSKMDVVSLFLDHTYDNCDEKSAHTKSTNWKRGLSNDDLVLGSNSRSREMNLKNSPFLDHSYQSMQRSRKFKTSDMCNTSDQKTNFMEHKNKSNTFNLSLFDHTYEDTKDTKVSKQQCASTENLTMDTEESDHSYVIPSADCEMMDGSSLESQSDSGTESLNGDEEPMSLTTEKNVTTRCLQNFHKEHAYVK